MSKTSSKVTIITGASSGIGKHLAQKAIREGHRLVLNARREDPLKTLQSVAPERVRYVVGDLSEKKTRQNMIKIANEFGAIDYLFNNAGFGYYGPLEGQTEENIESMISLNVTALIDMTRLSLPLLKKSEAGRILNLSSVLGRIELPFLSVYCATKHAVVGFSRALNLELAATNVTCTAICPSGVRTDFASVATNNSYGDKIDSFGEPVESIVDSIWQEKDVQHEVFYPSLRAAGSVYMTKATAPFVRTVIKNRVRKKGVDLIS
jgi:short-subunit dehydrogenase